MEDIRHGRLGVHVLLHVEEVRNQSQDHVQTQHLNMAGISVLEQALVHKLVTPITVQVRKENDYNKYLLWVMASKHFIW